MGVMVSKYISHNNVSRIVVVVVVEGYYLTKENSKTHSRIIYTIIDVDTHTFIYI